MAEYTNNGRFGVNIVAIMAISQTEGILVASLLLLLLFCNNITKICSLAYLLVIVMFQEKNKRGFKFYYTEE